MKVDYITQFHGVMYGSEEFYAVLREFELELKKDRGPNEFIKLKDDESLVAVGGRIKDLIEKGDVDMTGIEPDYKRDAAVLIMKSGTKEPLFVQRITSFNQEVLDSQLSNNSVKKRGNYITARYLGFRKDVSESTGKKEPYTLDYLYFIGITTSRSLYKSQGYFEWKDVTPPPTILRRNINHIRRLIKSLHDQEIELSPEIRRAYIERTSELAQMAWLIANPESSPNNDEVIKKAFGKNALPLDNRKKDKIYSDPNQIMRLELRTTLMAISSLIYDYQRHERQNIKESADIERLRECTTGACVMTDAQLWEYNDEKIAHYTAEIQTLDKKITHAYNKVLDRKYDSTKAPERHRIDEKTERSFKEMYTEIFGDLQKIGAVCVLGRDYVKEVPGGKVSTKGYDERRKYSNTQIFENRIFKIDKCFEDIYKMFDLIDSINIRGLKGQLEILKKAALVCVSTSASDSNNFTPALECYDRMEAGVRDEAEKMRKNPKNLIELDKSEETLFCLGKLTSMMRSKRGEDLAIELAKEKISQRGAKDRLKEAREYTKLALRSSQDPKQRLAALKARHSLYVLNATMKPGSFVERQKIKNKPRKYDISVRNDSLVR